MRLMAAGLDQRESALETRERFAFTASAAEDFMREMKGRGVESVLLSTCNRTRTRATYCARRAETRISFSSRARALCATSSRLRRGCARRYPSRIRYSGR